MTVYVLAFELNHFVQSLALASSQPLKTNDITATDRSTSVPAEADRLEMAATAMSSATQIKARASVLPSVSPETLQRGISGRRLSNRELVQ